MIDNKLMPIEAFEILARYDGAEFIGNLYDNEPNLREALNLLIPDFEYPDWAQMTLKQAIRTVQARQRSAL